MPAVVTGGTVVHIPAAGNSKAAITCRVLLLDGSDVSVELPVSKYTLTGVLWRQTNKQKKICKLLQLKSN